MEQRWRIELLGHLRACRGSEHVVPFQIGKTASLLAYLAYHAPHPQPRELLIELLWPEDDPEEGRRRLRSRLHALRPLLPSPGSPEGSLIVAERSTVGLDPAAVTTDVAEFRAALQAAAAAERRVESLSRAVALYGGELLPGYYEPWVLAARPALAEQYLKALGELSAGREAAGELEGALSAARQMVAADPLREEAHYDVMRLAAALGRPSAALRQYQELERVLREELDETPSAEARALAEEMRASGRTLVVARRGNLLPRSGGGAERQPPPASGYPAHAVGGGPGGDTEELKERAEGPPERVPAGETQPLPSVASCPGGEPSPAEQRPEAPLLPVQLTRFFGREQEIARLSELLAPGVGSGRSDRSDPSDPSDRPAPTPPPASRVPAQPPTPNARLVTVTGPGGSGKTRLAIAVAGRLRAAWDGRVAFVALADVTDAARLPDAIGDALALPRSTEGAPLAQVTAHLGEAPWLLVLDNLEHLVEEGALLVRKLLEEAPSLVCLVTSRQHLAIAGEQEFALLPLPTPRASNFGFWISDFGLPATATAPERRTSLSAPIQNPKSKIQNPEVLLQYPSVQLFVDRARAVKPDFALTEGNAAAVASLCRKLEGMPLAIEMAAAWTKTLPPARIVERLEHQFDLLVSRRRDLPARQQSLRAAIQWSYDLLTPALQACFARLSVFRGGWTLEAVEAVCDFGFRAGERSEGNRSAATQGGGSGRLDFGLDPTKTFDPPEPLTLPAIQNPKSEIQNPEVLELLAMLQDQSLILLEEGGEEERYRMLEPLRQFAAEKRAERGETEGTRQRHAEYFLALAEAAQPKLAGAEIVPWLDRLERERENLRAACDWFEADEAGAGQLVRLAAALTVFGNVREHPAEARARLERALARPSEPSLARVKVLQHAGYEVMNEGDLTLAQQRYEEALAIAQALGHRFAMADVLTNLAYLAVARGEEDRARSLYEASLGIMRALGSKRGIIHNLVGMGSQAERLGNLATARACFEESRALDRELGVKGGWAHWFLGRVAVAAGDFAAAREPWESFLRETVEIGNLPDVAMGLAGCARLAAAAGELERAARLWGAAVALIDSLGIAPATRDWARYERDVLAAGAVLGEAGLAAALAEGRAMPVEAAVADALGEVPPAAVRP